MGNVPNRGLVWQFNLKFDIDKEPYSPKSIEILKKAGINFEKLKFEGCDFKVFNKLINNSGNRIV